VSPTASGAACPRLSASCCSSEAFAAPLNREENPCDASATNDAPAPTG
jgi:hypothetical protein